MPFGVVSVDVVFSASEVRGKECQRCCDPGEEVRTQSANPQYPQLYPQNQAVPQINITILKGR